MSTPTILTEIAQQKAQEVHMLRLQHSQLELMQAVPMGTHKFQQLIEKNRKANRKFFITEFKRRSPSNPEIGLKKDPRKQANLYIEKGTDAISVLTDTHYFGGSHSDMEVIAGMTQSTPIAVLNKDFIIDELQIYLARKYGADIILLITAILTDEEMQRFHNLAVSLGMGTIAEVHTQEELDRVLGLDLPVIGINNRDLHTFTTCLNTTNYLARQIPKDRTIIAESGMASAIDFRICGAYAHGFLVGTSLMQGTAEKVENLQELAADRYYFKACGARKLEDLDMPEADLIGVNFSPKSKRKVDMTILNDLTEYHKLVALFYENTQTEIDDILSNYPFLYVQLYQNHTLNKQKKVLALSELSTDYHRYAVDKQSDIYILDGSQPGSGKAAEYTIPQDFPYPFLLAGGMNIDTLERAAQYPMCIGIDVASGIETDGNIDRTKTKAIAHKLRMLKN